MKFSRSEDTFEKKKSIIFYAATAWGLPVSHMSRWGEWSPPPLQIKPDRATTPSHWPAGWPNFSPIGRNLLWVIFWKLLMSSTFFGYSFLHGQSRAIILAETGLGYILGGIFTNSSGHPAWPDPKLFCHTSLYLNRVRSLAERHYDCDAS
jgi:hypothetical protein